MAKNKDKVAAIVASDIRTLEYIDDGKNYRITFQLGEARRWKEFSGGHWVQRPRGIGDTETVYDHIAAVHEDKGPFSGRLVNGLISLHNKWVKLNRDRKLGGEIQHQFVVISVEETKEPSIDRARNDSGLSRIEIVVKTAVREAVAAVMEEFTTK